METTTGGDHPTDFIPRDLVRSDDLRLDTFCDHLTAPSEAGERDHGDSNRQPRTQFGAPRPPDQPVIHSPICHQCLSTNGMTLGCHLREISSPPPCPQPTVLTDHASRRAPGGESPGLASNSTHSTMTPPARPTVCKTRHQKPIKSNLFPFPLPLYKKARHIKRISQRQAKSRKFFRISIFSLFFVKNVPKRTKSCHVDFVQTDTGGVREKGPVSTRVLS